MILTVASQGAARFSYASPIPPLLCTNIKFIITFEFCIAVPFFPVWSACCVHQTRLFSHFGFLWCTVQSRWVHRGSFHAGMIKFESCKCLWQVWVSAIKVMLFFCKEQKNVQDLGPLSFSDQQSHPHHFSLYGTNAQERMVTALLVCVHIQLRFSSRVRMCSPVRKQSCLATGYSRACGWPTWQSNCIALLYALSYLPFHHFIFLKHICPKVFFLRVSKFKGGPECCALNIVIEIIFSRCCLLQREASSTRFPMLCNPERCWSSAFYCIWTFFLSFSETRKTVMVLLVRPLVYNELEGCSATTKSQMTFSNLETNFSPN